MGVRVSISILLTLILCVHLVRGQGEQCKTRAGVPIPGQFCVLLSDCPSLMAEANKGNYGALRAASCGYDNNAPKVCCDLSTDTKSSAVSQNGPSVPTVITATIVTNPTPRPTKSGVSTGSTRCYTVDNQVGFCTSLPRCPALRPVLQTNVIEDWLLDYIYSSVCADGIRICCPSTPPVKVEPADECTSTALLPHPPTKCCGVEASIDNKIKGGNDTGIDEYPWLALIEYSTADGILFLCGGTLISGLYVLTAAHCIRGNSVKSSFKPVNIRLGEYKISNIGPDCVPAEGGEDDCTDEIVVIPIEEIIVHPNYDPSDRYKRHDIALIRLKTMAPYTDFIRPVCLPMSDVTQKPPPEFDLYAVGWGQVNETVSAADVKQDVLLPYVPQQQCQQSYKIPRRYFELWAGQMCAGGVKGKDTCKGDSGGPLVFENEKVAQGYKVFELIGVVSFGFDLCGLEDIPGIYTKVAKYLGWIRSNVRP